MSARAHYASICSKSSAGSGPIPIVDFVTRMLFDLFRRRIYFLSTRVCARRQIYRWHTPTPFFSQLCLMMQGHASRQEQGAGEAELILFPDDVGGTRDAKTTIHLFGGFGGERYKVRRVSRVEQAWVNSIDSLGVWGTGFYRWNINTSGSPQPAHTHIYIHGAYLARSRDLYRELRKERTLRALRKLPSRGELTRYLERTVAIVKQRFTPRFSFAYPRHVSTTTDREPFEIFPVPCVSRCYVNCTRSFINACSC